MSNERVRILPITILVLVVGALLLVRFTTHPSLERNWIPNQGVLPSIEIKGDQAYIRNIRNTDLYGTGDRTPVYFNRTWDLDSLRRAWFVMEDLPGLGAAHLMISFEFSGPEYLVFSPEPRLEAGETFSPLKGLLRRFEFAYILATETDILRHKSRDLGRPVTLFEMKADRARTREMFVDMAARARELAEKPEFYHTLFNNVSGHILLHVRTLTGGNLSGFPAIPSRVDRRLHKAGVFRHDAPLELLAGRGNIGVAARAWQPGMDFSAHIRRSIYGIMED